MATMDCAEERPEYVLIDCTDCAGREIARLYRDFAVACVERQLERVLVKAGGGDPQDHLSLRDAFTAMMLGGIPSGFRIALVTPAGRTEAVFRALQRDLCQLRIAAAVFGHEDEAREWLLSRPGFAVGQGETTAQRPARRLLTRVVED
jgi:hypothetical protein